MKSPTRRSLQCNVLTEAQSLVVRGLRPGGDNEVRGRAHGAQPQSAICSVKLFTWASPRYLVL